MLQQLSHLPTQTREKALFWIANSKNVHNNNVCSPPPRKKGKMNFLEMSKNGNLNPSFLFY